MGIGREGGWHASGSSGRCEGYDGVAEEEGVGEEEESPNVASFPLVFGVFVFGVEAGVDGLQAVHGGAGSIAVRWKESISLRSGSCRCGGVTECE